MPAGPVEVPHGAPVREAADAVATAQQLAQARKEIAELTQALGSRGLIATAVGLLAERYQCRTPQAWALLTRLSSHANLKVREVARLLVAEVDGGLRGADHDALRAVSTLLPPPSVRTRGRPEDATQG